ncbi:unnamed protein product [Brachionus calyciflorus]|uniref:Major facilitator superfamily (MFS) profile domain-containing protein n=1 Tax=Brachionus calyciflorus TaxID=104777 RepID=A0A813WX74_9BILA|nr:unnamed protein product [Brachionus calyciflorus]
MNTNLPNNHENITFKKLKKLLIIKNNNIALIVLSLCAFVQNAIVSGANNAILTTIERAFFMSSLDSALFLIVYDIANILASPIIGYYGDRRSKTKIISLSMIGLSLGSFLMIIPHFFHFNTLNSENFELSQEQGLCHLTNYSLINSRISSRPKYPNLFLNKMKFFFYASNMINGVSSVALYTIVISYIENIFKKEKVHLRQGFYYASGAIGVGIGMLATGNFLNINPKKKSFLQNFNWIGAWWIIYIISIGVNLFLSFIILLFSSKLILVKNDESSKSGNLNDFLKNACKIMTNKVFIFITICTTFETFLIKGFSSNLTKFLEYQFRLPASTATMIAGGIGLISLVFGPLLGAYIVKKLNWNVKKCSKFVLIILTITSFIFLGLIFTCPQEKFIKDNSNFIKSIPKSTCMCDTHSFYPLCHKNKFIFQSPCHAGCLKFSKPNNFFKCLGIDSYLNQSIFLQPCSRPNNYCTLNLIGISMNGLVVLFLSSIVILPILRIILESIDVENQSFALGIRSLINRLFGNIPGPIVFAIFIDRSCILWTKSPMTGSRVCRLYNNKSFSISLGILGSIIRFLSAVSAFLTFCFVRRQDKVSITDLTRPIENLKNDENVHSNKPIEQNDYRVNTVA